jgi:GH35 family endo-1,4-beta-xylanase
MLSEWSASVGRIIAALLCLVVVTRLLGFAAAASSSPRLAGASGPAAQPARELVEVLSRDLASSHDAEWRDEARRRIEQQRMAPIRMVIRDSAGRAVPQARVRIEMQRHAFTFGTAVSSELVLSEQSPDAHHYREALGGLFNSATPAAALSWSALDAEPQRARAVVERLARLGLAVRGPELLRLGWRDGGIPQDIVRQYQVICRLKNAAEAEKWLRLRAADHIRSAAALMAGKVTAWDVASDALEPAETSELPPALSPAPMGDWFAAARRADPAAGLLLGVGDLLPADAASRQRQETALTRISAMLDQRCPITGLAVHGHFAQPGIDPQQLMASLDRLASVGLPIQITELDVEADDEPRQAEHLRDALLLAFSHPKVQAVTLGGFWEGRHWRPAASLYRKDWSAKPAAAAYRDLVLGEWWTRQTMVSDDRGACALRGFLGDYTITVEHAGRTRTVDLTLGREGASVVVSLP